MKSPGKIRNLVVNLSLLIFSSGVFLGLAELTLRLILPTEWVQTTPLHTKESPYGISTYDVNPNSVGKTFGQEYHINELGLRGPETTFEKKPGVFRIAVVGDSMAFGIGLSDEQTLPAQLSERFKQLGNTPEVEVLNFGITAYGFDQYPELLQKKVLRFSPDLIILQTYVNDTVNPANFYETKEQSSDTQNGEGIASPETTAPLSRLIKNVRESFVILRRHSALMKLVSPLLKDVTYSILKSIKRDHLIIAQGRRDLEQFQNNGELWKQGQNSLHQFKMICEQHSIPLTVVIFPVMNLVDSSYRYKAYHDAVREFCIKSDIDVIDLYEHFYGANLWEHRVGLLDHHPDAAISAKVADILVQHLKDKIPHSDINSK